MPIVNGTLTDFGLDPLTINDPLLIFRASSTGIAGLNLLSARKPVEVLPASNGFFEADLISTSIVAPETTHYTVEIRFRELRTGLMISEVLPWKLLVPPEGGALGDLLRVPANPALVWTGTQPPITPSPGTWWLDPETGDLSELTQDGTTWEYKANLKGPAGYNATGAVEDDAALAAFIAAGSGGTATLTALEKLTGRISVTSRGAKLDGITNDSAAFQAAINDAADRGQRVYFPKGNARIGNTLNPRSNVTIEGEGAASVFMATTDVGSVFGTPTADLSDFTLRNLTFKGGATDLNQSRRRDRPVTASFTQAIRIIGSGYNGVVPGDTTVYPVIKNITLDGVRIVNTKTLPFYFAGVQNVTVRDCFIRNCMDPGFVYVDGGDVSHNIIENSADNGISVSRMCRNFTIADNVVRGSAHYGIWCAGYYSDVDGGIYAPGPQNFTITGNIIEDSGKGGIALSDAPKHGVVAGNTVIGVTNGNRDYPSVNDGTGIFVTGYPSHLDIPEIYAEDIIIADNVVKDAARNGVNVRGAQDITLDNNTFLNIGVETFVADYPAASIVAGQPVSPTSTSYNNGIITSGTGLLRLTVTSNRFLDTRPVPVSNYAVPSNVRSSTGFFGAGNRSINYRQPLGLTLTEFGDNGAQGYKMTLNAAASQNKDFAYQTAGVDRWIWRMATTNAMQLSRRLADGSQGSVPISVNWSTGEVTIGDNLVLNQGAYIAAGKTLGFDTVTGGIIGYSGSKLGFFGKAGVARPALSYSRAGESAAAAAMRGALAALGLVTDSTTA